MEPSKNSLNYKELQNTFIGNLYLLKINGTSMYIAYIIIIIIIIIIWIKNTALKCFSY